MSMVAVTTRRRACLMAAMPAAVSTSRMIVPPWTYPELLACSISIADKLRPKDPMKIAALLAVSGGAPPISSWMPRRRAAPLPILWGWNWIRIWGCADCSSERISREPSREPSSTQISSMSRGTAKTRATTSRSVACSL